MYIIHKNYVFKQYEKKKYGEYQTSFNKKKTLIVLPV